MKTRILLPAIGILALAALVYGYRQLNREGKADEKADKPISAASKVEHNAGGETVIALGQKTQQLIGLKTATLSAATLPPEINAYGRVLDPAPLVAALGDTASARATFDASSKEYQRLKALFAQGRNTSAKALETAGAAMERDRIGFQAAQAQLHAAWGKAIAGQPDLPAFVQSLAKLENVLVRLDVPAGEALAQTPTGAQLILPGTNEIVAARFLGRAATADAQSQGEGFLFVATNVPPRFASGLALAGLLELPGEPLRGVRVPDAAVIRSDETGWVYVQTGETNFTRRKITLEHPADGGWFVTNGVAPGDRVVVTGAQTLLSEERKSEIQISD